MNAQDIERLVRRLEAGNLHACEYDESDGSTLRLQFEARVPANDAMPAEISAASAEAAPAVPALAIKAPRFGHFLHHHPLSPVGKVTVGQTFQPGDTLGYIQAGEHVVAVAATTAGTVQELLAAHNQLVGYGQALIATN